MNWEYDYAFMRAAKLLWPKDLKIATSYSREKGKVDAGKRMQLRHDGFACWRALVDIQRSVAKAIREMPGHG